MDASESQAGIPLGPFVLDEVIGQAGMGVVWRGTHVEQRVPVAVKVLTLEGSRDPLYLASLRNEVRGVAALDHPAVVRIFDQGVLPAHVSEATGGDLAAGSPFLVMELAEGGTLLPLCGRLGWAQVWRVLVRMLDGLAHAHARGVIHRDIKPSNTLLRRKGAGVMLVDFGLARAGDRERGGSPFLDVGTPGYMAPEQIRRQWRDIGPWTDLYAVGCMATALVSARPPFVGDTVETVLRAHLDQPVPPLDPIVEVPEGFEAWVQQLLHKSHFLRFGRAADAIHALMDLVDEADAHVDVILEPLGEGTSLMTGQSTNLQQLGEITSGPLLLPSDTEVMEEDLRMLDRKRPVPAAMPALPPPLILCDRPSLPPVQEDWRPLKGPRQSVRLLGTGLGIFGFRELPVIGREEEQEQLWTRLRETIQEERGRAVVLSGAVGSGRSHLAKWLAQRAHQTGAATVHRISVTEKSGATEVLAPLVHQILRTMDMDRERTRVRISERLSLLGSREPVEVDSLVALLGPYPGEEGQRDVEFERIKARYVLVRRLLQRRSILRPVVLVLDDAHLSEHAIAFARHLLRAQEYAPHPILLVLTVGGMDLRKGVQSQLDEFRALDGVQAMDLGPLESDDREILVREILGLDRELAEIVARRSGGNPQFAVQLVGDWVQKGQLEVGPTGFRMRAGVTPEIPADLKAMWERRLAAVIPMDRDVVALEIAAVMGMEVDPGTWEEACQVVGISADWELVDRLLSAQLAGDGPGLQGWRFSHFLVADALVRRADFGGRLPAHHAAAVQVLERRDPDEVAPRLGRHLIGAGEHEKAVDVLMRGALGCIHRSEWNRAWALLNEREAALQALGIPKRDERWAEGWLAKARAVGVRNDLEMSMEMYDRVLATVAPGSSLAARALNGQGRLARIRGENKRAREILLKAREMCEGPPEVLIEILIQQGSLESHYGDVAGARRIYEEALEVATALGDEGMIHDVKFYMAGLYRRLGDEASARAALDEVHAWCVAHGRRERVAQCANDIAEMDRLHGDAEAAMEGYREALRLYEAVGARQAYVARTNLGIMAAEQGHSVEAREHLDRVVPMLKRMGLKGIEGLAHIVLMIVEAREGCWSAWDEQYWTGASLLEETGFVDVDVARSLELAGEIALGAGEVQRAQDALQLAQRHWEVLEREESAARVADLLLEVQAMQ